MTELGVRLGRGWQAYDPVIRQGRPQSYEGLFQELDKNSQQSAQEFIKYWNQGISENASPSHVILLILILCVCEVGRGYGQAPENMLWYANKIINDSNLTWGNLLKEAGNSPDFAFLCKGDTDEGYQE